MFNGAKRVRLYTQQQCYVEVDKANLLYLKEK